MFKKGQIVRSKRTGMMHMVCFNPDPRFTEFVWVISGATGRRLCVPTCEMELIGNNYKEKPRDAIPERRDSYK